MERGSDKHGPLHDEALKGPAEHESRAEEWHEVEPRDEPPDPQFVGGAPPGMQPADVVGRSELAGYLTGAPYPAVREQLIEVALEQHAPDHVVDEVRRLPSGRAFANVGDVWSTLGGGTERERF